MVRPLDAVLASVKVQSEPTVQFVGGVNAAVGSVFGPTPPPSPPQAQAEASTIAVTAIRGIDRIESFPSQEVFRVVPLGTANW
jgi:hypothetical protein